jgi:hypothetical protein
MPSTNLYLGELKSPLFSPGSFPFPLLLWRLLSSFGRSLHGTVYSHSVSADISHSTLDV